MEPARSTRPKSRRRIAWKRPNLGFELRLVVTLVLSLALVAAASVPVLEWTVRGHAIHEGTHLAEADARAIKHLMESAGSEQEGYELATSLMLALVRDSRVVDARLIDPRNRTVASPVASDLGQVESESSISDALRLGRSYAGPGDKDSDEAGDLEYVVPVDLPTGRHAYEVDQDASFVNDQVASARDLLLVGMALVVAAFIGLFYLLGGRRLGRLHRGALRDVSDLQKAEDLLEHQRRQLVEAQSVGGIGSWEWDVAAGTVEWSAELARMHGLPPSDAHMPFDTFIERVHPDDRAAVAATYASGESFSFEYRIVHPAGDVRVLHGRGEVVLGADGAPEKLLGTEQDITDRRAAERAKDEFTSIVSHELRTPLTSIRGSLGLLQSGVLGDLPDKGQRMVDIAVENTDRLVRLISDILDIERIDSGASKVEQQPCEAADLVERAVQGVEQFAAQAGVTLVVDATPVTLMADPDRILQTLTNLISNAVKFSPRGSVVRLSSRRQDDGALFAVRDEGRGIPVDKLETIFERFQQVDASDSREKSGTGLGLPICRSIVESHGGRIWVESEPGMGSTFSFLLPALPVIGSPVPDGAERRPAVLVCDDDPGVVEVVSEMLEQHGLRAIPAHSGNEALARATAERPDAILLDMVMPGADGHETAAALEQRAETCDIPIVILSVLPEATARRPGERFADWVEKPIDETALFDALEHAMHPSGDSFKVLVVEDDGDLAEVLTATLAAQGIEAVHAADGREGIKLSQQILPDLLVLDLGLPEADGFEVVEWLRRHERLRNLPLLIYTARELDDSDRERLRLTDTTEFLTKGQTAPEDLEGHVLRRLARLGRTHAKEARDEPEAHLVGR